MSNTPDMVRSIGQVRRRPIDLSAAHEVTASPLVLEARIPLVIAPAHPGAPLAEWAAAHPGWTDRPLLDHGALLFRGFGIDGVDGFQRFVRAISSRLLEYTERSTPRTAVRGDVYTSTEYPPHVEIVQHNENSYASTWPLKLAFYCEEAARTGGETPLADSAEVYRRIAERTREAFAAHGVMYVRNYGLGVDLTWQNAFQTTDPAAVEAHCDAASIAWEWLDGGRRLRTRQVRPAVARHPSTGEWLWFNQAHLFHTSTLDRATRDALHAAFAEEDLPRQSFLGDGRAIPESMLEEIRDAYRECQCAFAWQSGDVLLLDNMKVSHGRRSFTGRRRVLVAMADPWSQTA